MAVFVLYILWDCAVISQQGVVVHRNTAGDGEVKGLNQCLSHWGT